MGHKKRSVAPRSKPSSPGAVSLEAGDGQRTIEGKDFPLESSDSLRSKSKSEPSVSESEVSNYSAIKLECERALTALRRGNHTKALRLMKEACHRYENSALIHRVQGTICVKVASMMDDPTAKQRHLRNAIESARKAVSLSLNSIEFAHFYANLLYEAANDAKEYEEVVQECERALSLENPIDPAKESLQEESQQKIATADARIGHVQSELRSLIQKSNIASISTWMKNLGSGNEEKFRLIPIRRLSEDPMEVRLVQTTRRPNEIKKATKTTEERRKEIEVRVAAARLLQQKSESSAQLPGNEAKESELNSTGNHKSGERRKHGNSRKNATSAERKDLVKSYWNSVSYETKRDLLNIRVSDLRAHLSSSKDGLACEVLSEALSFAEANKSWKFWACCRCGERFADSESHMQHVVQEHMGNLLPKMQSVLPQNVDGEWVEMLRSCSWKPIDLAASVRMLDNQSKSSNSSFPDKFNEENHMEESKDIWSDSFCSDDAWESFPEKKNMVSGCNGNPLESKENDKGSETECKECDGRQSLKAYTLPNSWPLSDDIERGKLLEKINSIFQALTGHKFLAVSHLQKVIQFAMDELQGLASDSQLLKCGLDQTPLCICFLGASQLRKIIKFLKEVSHACGVDRYTEKISSDDASIRAQMPNLEEKIVLNEDSSCLLLDENLLPSDAIWNNAGSTTSSVVVSENGAQPSSDALLSWMYAGASTGEQLATWSRIREEKAQQGMEFLQMLEKEFGHLQGLCDRKYEQLGYEEALQGLEELFLEKSKRENVNEFAHGSYETVLRKRREELIERENDVMFISNRFELEAISNVLKEAENLNVNQYGYEETYGGMTSRLCDLDAGEDDWKSKDYLHQVDTCIEVAIQKQKEQLSVELSKIDARIMRNVASMQQLELKLEPVSALDYRLILLSLVKSLMQARLENLAEKDAAEKSDVAREAFLAELALDSKKGVGGGSDISRNLQEKPKDKKGTEILREPRIPRLLAALVSNLILQLPPMIELEAEERKLEETLEYQRRIENEAKQKHVAEQRKRNAASDDVAKVWVDFSLQPGISVEVHYKQAQESQSLKNGFAINTEDIQRNVVGADTVMTNNSAIIGAQKIKSAQNHHRTEVKQGLVNGGVPNGVLPSTTGRKGKRKNSAKLQEGINHALPPVGESGSKTLRELHAEEDDEERFQADMEKAVRQSLDTFQAHQKQPFFPSSRAVQKISQQSDDLGTASSEEFVEHVNGVGTGLQNEVGEYNCFLNVIIQSMWHLRRFREEFLRRSTSEHVHVGDPCVVCALYDILTALSMSSTDAKREAVAPTSLRIALSNLYPESNFFQEGQMNDASEVLVVIFECLHQSFTSALGVSDTESMESSCLGSWDCNNKACIAHTHFGMDIFERMNCYNCGLESRNLKYTTFFHYINASALRTMKAMCAESSFDEVLNLVEMNHQLACDPEAGGCGKLNHTHHILSTPPHVFTTVLGWQNSCESIDDITATLAALATEIDTSVLYRGLDPKNMHHLVSVVCYYGQHYHCFAYSHDHEQWMMYDDKTVKVIGTWKDVIAMCERGHLQPQVLFYEAIN
ncbi:hypothetical protein Nepgr_018671 [Nepenthes gracilis]|uniref:USP domain-containing protein n=1 Tax=Nepenthes gracilis TaxID=150966 RepID=A0AAD3XUH6_NEPGR|nr:hypothetical protein Nepgr_018671 [Nepenthes gracilis]